MKRISIFSVFLLTIFIRAPIAQDYIVVDQPMKMVDVSKNIAVLYSDSASLLPAYTFSPTDSPYVGSVNGWEFSHLASDGIYTEIGSYFSEKYGQQGQTFYHKGKSTPVPFSNDSLFWMNTYFRKNIETFTLPREFWITANLDFFESDTTPSPWFDFNIWHSEDGFWNGIFMLGIGYFTPWDSVQGPVTFVVKMPDAYYQESIDSGFVYEGLTINVMSSMETTQSYAQELGWWFGKVVAVDYDKNGSDTTYLVLDDFSLTSYREDDILVPDYVLYQNYPNPFNPSTYIKFSLPVSGYIRIDIYSILGERVMTVANGYYAAGNHRVSVDFSKKSLPSGVYVYTLTSSHKVISKKMVFLK